MDNLKVEAPQENPYLLTGRAIVPIDQQLALFTGEALHLTPVLNFDPRTAYEVLETIKEQPRDALGTDINAIRCAWASLMGYAGEWNVISGSENSIPGEDLGSNYLTILSDLNKEHPGVENIGISITGECQGTRFLGCDSLSGFNAQFQQQFDGNFQRIFAGKRVIVVNRSVATLVAGSMQMAKAFPQVKDCILVMVGAGLGAAVLKNKQILTARLEDVPIPDQMYAGLDFDPHGIQQSDAQDKHKGIRLELGGGAGIIWMYKKLTGESATGKKIAERYLSGEKLAGDLFEFSARIAACVICGLAQAAEIPVENNQLGIVLHGGGPQNVPGYMDRIQQIINHKYRREIPFLYTDPLVNIAIMGSGLLAILPEIANFSS